MVPIQNRNGILLTGKVDILKQWPIHFSTLLNKILEGTDDSSAQRVLDELLAYPDIPQNWRQRGAEIAFNHNFRFVMRGEGEQLHTMIAVNNTVGVTPYVAQPRLLINSLNPLDPDMLPPATELANLSHPLLAGYPDAN